MFDRVTLLAGQWRAALQPAGGEGSAAEQTACVAGGFWQCISGRKGRSLLSPLFPRSSGDSLPAHGVMQQR